MVLVALAAGVGVALVVTQRGGDSSSAADAESWNDVVAGLCDAAVVADDGATQDARRVFYDESHDGLHRLAAQVTETDRSAAARLLEAKIRVEEGLDDAAASLGRDLVVLAETTRDAIGVVEETVPPACRTEE
jgi:hypothetical protein